MTNTPGASLPYPVLGAAPNVPSDMQALATALDTKVPGSFATSTARDSAMPAPADGQPAYRTDIHSPEQYSSGIGGWTHGCVLFNETIVGGPLSSITFTIPQDFRDLRITTSLRDTTAANSFYNWALRINGDAGAVYSSCGIFNSNLAGANATFTNSGLTSTGNGLVAAGGTSGSNVRGNGVMDIPFYAQSGTEKTGAFVTSVNNGGGTCQWQQGVWFYPGSVAITSITVVPNGGTSIATGSIFRLFGIG